MRYCQVIVIVLAVVGIAAVLTFPPQKVAPEGQTHSRLSWEWADWQTGDYRQVDRWDLFTEMFAILGIAGSLYALLEMRKRAKKVSEKKK